MQLNTRRILIIGLDGASWTVLEPYIETGILPNLAKIRMNGCYGNLESTIPPLSAPAWSSFLTGKNPGKHGVFHFKDVDVHGEYSSQVNQHKTVDARSIKSSTMWDFLGHHDRKVGIINVPMSYPPRPVNGFLITGFFISFISIVLS